MMTQTRPKIPLDRLELLVSGMDACLTMNLLDGYLTNDERSAFLDSYWQFKRALEIAKAHEIVRNEMNKG